MVVAAAAGEERKEREDEANRARVAGWSMCFLNWTVG
jgi:hypothetical protein